MNGLNVFVVGAGMYVCGRGTDEYGTVMPALCEWKKENDLGDVYIVGTNVKNVGLAKLKIKELKRRMGIEIFVRYFPEGHWGGSKSYRDALSEIPKPACAIVAVPDHLHKKVASATIKEGLHTLVVKPLTPTIKETSELIRLQRKKKVYCAVEFHKRFDHANIKLKDVIAQGLIGEPLYFLVEFSQRKNIPTKIFKKWVGKTNVFQYLGIHYVDIVYFATGALPRRVMAIGQKGWLRSKGIDTYDSIQGLIEWELPSGRRFNSHIATNWIDPESTSAMSDQRIKVIGTKGRFESDQKKRGITIVTDNKGTEEPNPYFCCAYGKEGEISYRGYGIESIQQFLSDIVEIEAGRLRIDELEDKRPTFKQSVVPTAVLEGINKSLKNNGKWVNVRIGDNG